MNAPILMPPFTPDSQFYPATREWRVSPRIFADIQKFCLDDPFWAERNMRQYTGFGEVKIVMIL